MTTLPSPPLSPVDAPYTSTKLMTSPTRRGYRKEHHRHPERRRDTFELLQALVIEHQRLEQQEYETMLKQAPSISCRTPTKLPKGILVNTSNREHNDSEVNAQQTSQLRPSTRTNNKAELTLNDSHSLSRDKDHFCPTIPPSSIPATERSPPRSSKIAFALSPPITPSSSSLSSSSAIARPYSSSPSPLSSSYSSPVSSSSSSPSQAPRHSVVRFSVNPPKIYRYPKLPGNQEI
ncbi:hypothetical protein BCR42DRAFT_408018 [Absidia repens]|uniref:Uncharacterized protein n=1 Tax=Absidia repens TaxID=90262 RepID=A0A1X2IT42_9FUNG|nr:hypothetical protein BCR42DRAFT_408018 [Absidia repens]